MSWTTCDLYDAHEGVARVPQIAWRDFGGRTRFAGPVVTVKCFEDNSRIKALGATPGEGRVLVVDGEGGLRCALVGDMIGADFHRNGWAGLVIWGAVRDTAELGRLDLGVKALGAIPRKSVRRGEGVVDVELAFGGVAWRPGDVLFADEDGVILLDAGAEIPQG